MRKRHAEKHFFPKSFHKLAFTGPTWRPWPVLRQGLHRLYVEAFTDPTWRPWPVLRGGLRRPYVEAFTSPTRNSPALRGGLAVGGPTWRPWPACTGPTCLGWSYVEAEALACSTWSCMEALEPLTWPYIEAFTGPTWRPSPVLLGSLRGGLGRPWPVPRGGLTP